MIRGIGIDDTNYQKRKVKCTLDSGKIVYETCPFYKRWIDMISRCYSESYLKTRPTYRGCSVSDEWLIFSNFKSWMEGQNWVGKVLDKDLLIENNRVYSEDSCVFIRAKVNTFLNIHRSRAPRCLPVGCYPYHNTGKFLSMIGDRNTGKQLRIGIFDDEISAHKAWQRLKIKQITEIINEESCQKTVSGLIRVQEKLCFHLKNDILTIDL